MWDSFPGEEKVGVSSPCTVVETPPATAHFGRTPPQGGNLYGLSNLSNTRDYKSELTQILEQAQVYMAYVVQKKNFLV